MTSASSHQGRFSHARPAAKSCQPARDWWIILPPPGRHCPVLDLQKSSGAVMWFVGMRWVVGTPCRYPSFAFISAWLTVVARHLLAQNRPTPTRLSLLSFDKLLSMSGPCLALSGRGLWLSVEDSCPAGKPQQADTSPTRALYLHARQYLSAKRTSHLFAGAPVRQMTRSFARGPLQRGPL